MNLPAHGTASPDPSIASLLKRNTHKSHSLQHHRLAQPKRRQAKPMQIVWQNTSAARRLVNSEPLFHKYRLVEHTLPLGATWCKDLSRCSYRLEGISRPLGAIPEAHCY